MKIQKTKNKKAELSFLVKMIIWAVVFLALMVIINLIWNSVKSLI